MNHHMQRQTGPTLPTPSDLELEQQLLGSLLMFPEAVEPVAAILKPHEFAEALHCRIYAAILAATRSGIPASAFTLKGQFDQDPAIRSLGVNYLASLCGVAVHCLDPVAWARQVHSLAFRREIIQAAQEIQAAATDSSIEFGPEKIAEYAEHLLTSVTADASPSSFDRFKPFDTVAAGVLEAIGSPEGEKTIPFGISSIDQATGGMRRGEFVVIGARPGMGKTAVGAHIAKAAAQAGHAAAFFSMEMGADAISLRLLTGMAFRRYRDAHGEWVVPDDVPAYEAARRRTLSERQMSALFKLGGELAGIPLHIHEGRGLSPNQITLAAKRLRNELRAKGSDLALVVVDHLQKVKPDRQLSGNKVGEMTEITDALQKLAGNENLAVIGLSQLSRASEKRDDKRPQISDLRESGSIEQDADLILMLYREAYYLSKDERSRPGSPGHTEWTNEWHEKRNKLEIALVKHRNGPEGIHEVFFHAPSSWIGELHG